MSAKFDKDRDPFTFSLRGITALASFVAPTAIEIDRMNRLHDQRIAHSDDSSDWELPDQKSIFGRFWLRSGRRKS